MCILRSQPQNGEKDLKKTQDSQSLASMSTPRLHGLIFPYYVHTKNISVYTLQLEKSIQTTPTYRLVDRFQTFVDKLRLYVLLSSALLIGFFRTDTTKSLFIQKTQTTPCNASQCMQDSCVLVQAQQKDIFC